MSGLLAVAAEVRTGSSSLSLDSCLLEEGTASENPPDGVGPAAQLSGDLVDPNVVMTEIEDTASLGLGHESHDSGSVSRTYSCTRAWSSSPRSR